jgi:hypothetical protein
MAAFNMAQPLPAQPLGMVTTGMVAPISGIPSMVPSIGSINTGMYGKRSLIIYIYHEVYFDIFVLFYF